MQGAVVVLSADNDTGVLKEKSGLAAGERWAGCRRKVRMREVKAKRQGGK